MVPDNLAERTRRRITLRAMPFLILAYVTAYLDRANISIFPNDCWRIAR